MYSIIYVIIAFIVALSAGVWLYRTYGYKNGIDYMPAIAAGLLWPLTLLFVIFDQFLDMFRNICVYISNNIDDAKKKSLEKDTNSKEP